MNYGKGGKQADEPPGGKRSSAPMDMCLEMLQMPCLSFKTINSAFLRFPYILTSKHSNLNR